MTRKPWPDFPIAVGAIAGEEDRARIVNPVNRKCMNCAQLVCIDSATLVRSAEIEIEVATKLGAAPRPVKVLCVYCLKGYDLSECDIVEDGHDYAETGKFERIRGLEH